MPDPTRTAPPKARRSSRATVVRRLYLAIDPTLQQLEAAMAKDEPLTAADHERETRALHTIIRNVEKVRELETGKRPPAATGAKRSAAGRAKLTDDPEILRLELAERILRLRERRPAVSPEPGDGA